MRRSLSDAVLKYLGFAVVSVQLEHLALYSFGGRQVSLAERQMNRSPLAKEFFSLNPLLRL